MSTDEIKKLLKSDKLVIGTDRVLKGLRKGELEKVFLALNCNEETKGDIKHFAELSDAKVEELEIPNEELGILCKKVFSVSVIGILK